MVFALDNADAAAEVVDILEQSLTLAETPVPLKVGHRAVRLRGALCFDADAVWRAGLATSLDCLHCPVCHALPFPQVARLFLVSDILHNSTAPVRNASRYRTKLQLALPQVFESLQVRCMFGGWLGALWGGARLAGAREGATMAGEGRRQPACAALSDPSQQPLC